MIILKQLILDLIGKDANRGVTLSYAWLSNQFGHFAFGFMTAVGLYFFLDSKDHDYTLWGAVISVLFWLAFEIVNFVVTVFRWKQRKDFPFPIDYPYLIFDFITDLGFFWVGGFVFYAGHHTHIWWIPAGIVLLCILMFIVFMYWYQVRIHQEHANLPFSYNLARWKGHLHQDQVDCIQDFARENDAPKHLLLFGPRNSEKNSLAVAIGNELVIRKKRLYYMGVNHFFRMLHEHPFELKYYRGGQGFWNWRECDALIIDHINPGDPVPEDLVTSEMTLRYILNDTFSMTNQATLLQQTVVWVVGDLEDKDRAEETIQSWKTMLTELGVSPNHIEVIDMPGTPY